MTKILQLTPLQIEVLLQVHTQDASGGGVTTAQLITRNALTYAGLLECMTGPVAGWRTTPLGKAVVKHLCQDLAVEESFIVRPAVTGRAESEAQCHPHTAGMRAETACDLPGGLESLAEAHARLRKENETLRALLDTRTKLDEL